MPTAANRRRAAKAAQGIIRKYGEKSASVGPRKKLDGYQLSTGITSLDYALGGGLQSGSFVEAFGPPDIGKSSAFGLSVIHAAQEADLLCAIINLEPGLIERADEASTWLRDNDVDPEGVVMAYPDSGDEAFDILFTYIDEKAVDLILFDSIGAVTNESEMEAGKGPKVGGESRLISWGMTRVAQRAEKNNVTTIFINQVRDRVGESIGGVKTPGGWAKEHLCQTRIQLRPGKDKWSIKHGKEEIFYGRDIIARIVRNKLNRGTGQRAEFTYFQRAEEGHKVGIDRAKDVGRMAKTTGVLKKDSPNSTWFHHPSFPEVGAKGEHKINGEEAVFQFLRENPEARAQLRSEVMEKMEQKKAELAEAEKKPAKTKAKSKAKRSQK